MIVPLFTVAVAFAVSSTLLLLVVAAVWWLDLYEREPLRTVIGVFGWGALVAPILAIFAERLVGLPLAPGTARLLGVVAAGPAIEELLKGIGVLGVVALTTDFDNPTDGAVYGTAAGLGFALTENALYAAAVAGSGGDAVGLLVGRTFYSAGVHALASATFGGMVGFAHLSRGWLRRGGLLLAGAIGATLLHALWNGGLLWVELGGGGAVPEWLWVLPALYATYAGLLLLFLQAEHRILVRQLEEEVAWGILPGWVSEVVPFYRRRVRSGWWPSRSERAVLARLLTRLAFRKHALSRLPADEAAIAGLEVIRLRQRVRTMLAPPPDEVRFAGDA